MIKILCVIPSRIASTRMPRKPLLPIQGKPMLQWVYENACRCPDISKVIVATDSKEILDLITKLNGQAQLTDPDLPTGSDRAAQIAKDYPDMDVIINLQGDEPFITPQMLTDLVTPFLQGENPEMTTLAHTLDMHHDYTDPGSVKVITDLAGNALYFSRAPIPYFRENVKAPVYHHKGVYAFRRDFLLQYTMLPQTPLEKTESLEQLRVLEHGFKIRVCLTKGKTLEVNTKEEYERAQHFVYCE